MRQRGLRKTKGYLFLDGIEVVMFCGMYGCQWVVKSQPLISYEPLDTMVACSVNYEWVALYGKASCRSTYQYSSFIRKYNVFLSY